MRHGSLFSGIGGFDLGFERAGIEPVFQVEINDFARKILEMRFPNVRRINDVQDVYRFADEYSTCKDCGEEPWCERHNKHFGECDCIGCSQWDDEIGAVDIITGGDPCQENSNARRATETTTAPSLGAEFIRIVERLRPRIVVRENPTSVRADAPWPWWRFRSELERLGYAVLPFRLRACCLGADIRRDRLFLLAELPKSDSKRLERDEREIVARAQQGRSDADSARSNRRSAAPRICGAITRVPKRVDRLRTLGNCVLPDIAEWIGRRIVSA